jgi:NAD(P)-dependent dehydrogenase (short-subunit alcohol dehydrogenase family)
MTEQSKTALVVGATGVIGTKLVEELQAQGDWAIIGLFRRASTGSARTRYISVDLLDTDDTRDKLKNLREVTHSSSPGSSNAPAGPRWSHPTWRCSSTSSTSSNPWPSICSTSACCRAIRFTVPTWDSSRRLRVNPTAPMPRTEYNVEQQKFVVERQR